MSDVAVIVPAYNEAAVIGTVLSQLVGTGHDIVVVDDGSRDDTAEVAARFPVTVLRHAINLGQGAALQTGIEYAAALPHVRFIVTFDSDGQHDAADLDALVAPLRDGSAAVVLGSRFLTGARAENLPLSKRITLQTAILFTRFTTKLRVTDVHNGLRALRVDVARELKLRQNRMAHASEILTWIADRKLPYQEVPVRIEYTDYSLRKGQSMFHSLNILWEVLTARLG